MLTAEMLAGICSLLQYHRPDDVRLQFVAPDEWSLTIHWPFGDGQGECERDYCWNGSAWEPI